MNPTLVDRRTLITGLSATLAIGSLQRASAASLPPINPSYLTSGTWFEQVKAQHTAIAETLADIIADGAAASSERAAALRQLSYLLTAHSVAEENVLYPALIFAGLTVDSADLYLEQQFQKIWNAEIDYKATRSDPDWLDKVKRLQGIILEHAKAHEEADYYPKLQAKLDGAQNELLSDEFRAQFLSIKEPS